MGDAGGGGAVSVDKEAWGKKVFFPQTPIIYFRYMLVEAAQRAAFGRIPSISDGIEKKMRGAWGENSFSPRVQRQP
jgi:hypothetical protein